MTLSVVKAPIANGRSIDATSFADITNVPVVIRPDGTPAIDFPFVDPATGNTVLKVVFGDPIVNGTSTYPGLTWAIKQQCARRIMAPGPAEEDLLNQIAAVGAPPADLTARVARLEDLLAKVVPVVLGQGVARVDDNS